MGGAGRSRATTGSIRFVRASSRRPAQTAPLAGHVTTAGTDPAVSAGRVAGGKVVVVVRPFGTAVSFCNLSPIFRQSQDYSINAKPFISRSRFKYLASIRQSSIIFAQSRVYSINAKPLISQFESKHLASLRQSSTIIPPIRSPIMPSPGLGGEHPFRAPCPPDSRDRPLYPHLLEQILSQLPPLTEGACSWGPLRGTGLHFNLCEG